MKLLQNGILVFMTAYALSYAYAQTDVQQNLTDIQNTVNKGQQTLNLDFIPQFQDYSSKIPKQIKDILGKANLTDLQVDYDSSAGLGAISATTDIAGTPAIVRIIIGKTLTTGTTFQEKFMQNMQSYQSKLSPQKTSTSSTQTSATFVSSEATTPEAKQEAINEALQKQTENSQENNQNEGSKTDTNATDTSQKQSWVSKQLDGYQGGIVLVLPQGFKFASISSDLKFLDYINFEEIALGIGSGFSDPVYGDIPKGFALVAKVNSNIEPFNTIANFLNKIPGPAKVTVGQPFTLRGGILPSIGGSSFSFGLPGQITFNLGSKPIAQTDQLNMSVILLPSPAGGTGASGFSAGLSSGLTVYLNNVDSRLNSLDFQAAFAIDTSAEATITGIMQGLLNLGAVGLPLQFGNITLTIGVNPENVETLGLAEIGMMGEVDFGSTTSDTSLTTALDVKLSGQNTNILVYGDLEPKAGKKDALSLKDIVNLAVSAFNELGADIDTFDSKLPDLGIQKATFYFSPQNTIFANKFWKAGAKVDLELDLLGTTAALECDINSSGFEATGFMSEVDLGPLKITGAGGSKQCSLYDSCLQSCDSNTTAQQLDITDPNTPKDTSGAFQLTSQNVPKTLQDWTDYSSLKGPIVNLKFKPPTNIGLFISAEVDLDAGNLGTFKTDACLDVSLKGVNAHFEVQVFDILDTVFTLNAKDFLKPKDWYVCAKIKQNGLTLLEQEVSKLVAEAKQEVATQIQNAQDQVESAKRAYDDAFNTAQSAISSAQEKVTSLKSQLDSAKNECAGQSGNAEKRYPYQRPHQFNTNYVLPNYIFLGFLTIHGSESYTATLNNKQITLKGNTPHALLNDFVQPIPQKFINLPMYEAMAGLQKFMQNTNNPLFINNGKSLSFELMPSNRRKEPIKVLMKNTNNNITTYVWRTRPNPVGYKIIFDTTTFAEYVTQTAFYNSLGSAAPIYGFAFGLTINGDNLDITDPKNTAVAINRMFNINVLYPLSMNGLNLLDISLFAKISEKNLKMPMSYTDLFYGNEKIIQVVPLNTDDFKALNIKG